MRLTQIQLCQKYGISSWTFKTVKDLLTKDTSAVQHGQMFYDLTEEDDLLLICAGAHSASFATSKHRLLPFHRFLCYRLMTTNRDEVLEDLYARGLVTDRFGKSNLSHIEGHLISRLPSVLRGYVADKACPRPEHIALFKKALLVIGANPLYDNPVWADDFALSLANPQAKINVEAILTTNGSMADKVTAMSDLCGFSWPAQALTLYESLFYDIGYMSDADIEFYFKYLTPTERRAKKESAKLTPLMLSVLHNQAAHIEEAQRVAAIKISKTKGRFFQI